MMRRFVVLSAVVVLVVSTFAEDAAACRFRRRRCEYPPVPCCPAIYVPCTEAVPPSSGGAKATKELAKEIKDLAKKIEKPKGPVPETPADVAKILGGK